MDETSLHADTGVIEDGGLIEDWAARPWLLAGLGALAGLLIHLITGDHSPQSPAAAGMVALIVFFALAMGFTLRANKLVEPLVFSGLLGLVMGGIAWQVVAAEGHRSGVEFAFAAGCFFALLALPLFQADFHRKRLATDYRTSHFHVWADAVSGAGALAFVGLSWLALVLMDGLFGLVGIEAIGKLMREDAFGLAWSGGTFGAGLGVIRNNLKVIGALQKVVMLVFAILAVPFAAALLVFLAILLASGGKALWEATDSATPILLTCAAGAFILANAIIRDSDEDRSPSRIMQIAAALLAGLILPLSAFAAISLGIRIDQHGLSPERIWALIAIAVACAYGLACWVALIRGRKAMWSARMRDANLHLAAGVCVVALVLALPFWDFGALSARNQVARLEAGKVTAEDFDFDALRWNFGDAGRAALAKLAKGEGEVARLAAEAKAMKGRPYEFATTPVEERRANLRGVPEDKAARDAFAALLRREGWRCGTTCHVLELETMADGRRHFILVDGRDAVHLAMAEGGELEQFFAPMTDADEPLADPSMADDGAVEVREETVRRVYVDGKPVGAPFK
ncbi:DUF4153 domain-containing protein [Aurantiacibacter xanthus]|uniref:DUF4153 domain-containing protein n=1 Tax=Aurantiacibacter xanthus TaxID=1784712 RepID=A0A3A1P2D3_9SPHN|nr:DUF4153 domain-containing protein [Aurantiacibacter xanthus]RIV83240.1 DUF4153 domain-containing protein [Aurantiacibacter xanthus]